MEDQDTASSFNCFRTTLVVRVFVTVKQPLVWGKTDEQFSPFAFCLVFFSTTVEI